MKTTFTEAQRRTVALGWPASGLDRTTYAAQNGISAQTLRGWIARFPSRQPAADQVRAIVTELVEKLQAVLDGLDVPNGMPAGDEGDEPDGDVPTSIGMPGGSGEDVPEVEEPDRPSSIAMSHAGAACPAAPPPPGTTAETSASSGGTDGSCCYGATRHQDPPEQHLRRGRVGRATVTEGPP